MNRPPVADLGPCRGCGYDLRGLRPGGACPECGERIPSGTATLGGTEGRRVDDLVIGLGWMATASLWPLPLAFGCTSVTGWFAAPLLVATTGLSWLRLLGVRKLASSLTEARSRATGAAAIAECVFAGILAALVFVASFLPIPRAVPTAAYLAWIAAAAVATILARRTALATARAGGDARHQGVLGVLDGALAVILALGVAAMLAGRSVSLLPANSVSVPIATALAVVSIVGGLAASLAGFGFWRATRELADDLPYLPRFEPPRRPAITPGIPPRPEPAPLEVAPPRPAAEREPIELAEPSLPPRERPEPADRPPDGDDDLWNGWKT